MFEPRNPTETFTIYRHDGRWVPVVNFTDAQSVIDYMMGKEETDPLTSYAVERNVTRHSEIFWPGLYDEIASAENAGRQVADKAKPYQEKMEANSRYGKDAQSDG
jgi:hypothetical protein